MNYTAEIDYADIDETPRQLAGLLQENKVVTIRGNSKTPPAMEYLTTLVDSIGKPFYMDEDIVSGEATGNRWIDITYDPEILNRYRTAPFAQPLHTDFSYYELRNNVQILYCLSQADLGGATTFLDTRVLVELLELSGELELLKDLTTIPVTFSKDERSRTSTILTRSASDWRINWNYYCRSRSNSEEALDLVERFRTFLEKRVEKSGLLDEVLLSTDDVVFFHDELVLHGRNSYFAKSKGGRSLLKGTFVPDPK